MKNYKSPTGSDIIGTSDTVLATATIQGIEDDGTPVYAGGSNIHWDSQETRKLNGKILFLDESGCEWTFDQLIPVELGGIHE